MRKHLHAHAYEHVVYRRQVSIGFLGLERPVLLFDEFRIVAAHGSEVLRDLRPQGVERVPAGGSRPLDQVQVVGSEGHRR